MARRFPVRSVLAERRMFSNGGMLPISTPFQNQASGILASSSPLIEAVAQDAVNPMGGQTLSMANGGSVVDTRPAYLFSNGGWANYDKQMRSKYGIGQIPKAIDVHQIPTSTPRRTIHFGGDLEASYDPNNPVEMGMGDLLRETAAEKSMRLFPPYAAYERASFDEQFPEFKKAEEEGEPYSRATEFGARALTAAKDLLPGRLGAMADDVESVMKYLFDRGTRTQGSLLNARMITGMIEARPDLEQDILQISKSVVQSDPEINSDALRDAISMEISGKYEIEPHLGPVYEAEEWVPGVEKNIGTGQIPVPEESSYQADVEEQAENLRIAMAKGPEDHQTFMEEFSNNPQFSPSFQRDVLASVQDYGPDTPEVSAAEYKKAREELMFPEGTEKGIAEAAGEPYTPPEEEDKVLKARPPTTPKASAETVLDYPQGTEKGIAEAEVALDAEQAKNAEQARKFVSNLTNPNLSEKETRKTLEDHKKEFMDQMPEYEGMSEEEKGFALMEAGLRVAAGESPNAITNVAKGLKGIGDTFAKDDEEKRKWNRSVDLSAAKYSLEAVKADDTKLEALAKERRALKTFVVGKPFTHDGTKYTQGSLFVTDVGTVRTDGFAKNILPNLTTEGIFKERLDNAGATANIVRVGAKHGPSSKDVEQTLLDYTNLTKDARNNAMLMTMLDTSLITNAQGGVTGFSPWASKKLNQLANSVGMQKEIKLLGGIDRTTGRGLEMYQARQQIIANMMLKEILGEGSKNVSNIDRTLASEIAGLMEDWGGIFADKKVLHYRMQHIRNVVNNSLEQNLTRMRSKETAYRNVFTAFGPSGPGEEVSKLMGRQRGRFVKDVFGTTQRATQRDKERISAAGQQRKPAVLRASDYFDFNNMTFKKKLPGVT